MRATFLLEDIMTHYTRRRVLKMVGVVTIAGAAGQILPLPPLRAAQSPAHVAGLDDFMQVSRLLTQQQALNITVGRALLLALSETLPGVVAELGPLKSRLQNQAGQQPDLADNPYGAPLSRAILEGWYTGVVGKGSGARYVTYVNTLANLAVSDKLVPPGFAYGECGSWAKRP